MQADNLSKHASKDVQAVYDSICATCKHCICHYRFYDGSHMEDGTYNGDKVQIVCYCDALCANVYDNCDDDLYAAFDGCSAHEDADADE